MWREVKATRRERFWKQIPHLFIKTIFFMRKNTVQEAEMCWLNDRKVQMRNLMSMSVPCKYSPLRKSSLYFHDPSLSGALKFSVSALLVPFWRRVSKWLFLDTRVFQQIPLWHKCYVWGHFDGCIIVWQPQGGLGSRVRGQGEALTLYEPGWHQKGKRIKSRQSEAWAASGW